MFWTLEVLNWTSDRAFIQRYTDVCVPSGLGLIRKVRTYVRTYFFFRMFDPPSPYTQFLWRHSFANTLAYALVRTPSPRPSVHTYFMDPTHWAQHLNWTSAVVQNIVRRNLNVSWTTIGRTGILRRSSGRSV